MFYEKDVLENGVTVLSEHMDDARSVALGLWVRIGNRDESRKDYGMSHFMEHMVFKGTPTRTAADISMLFDGIGAELNAFTSREYTCFYARMMDEHLQSGFEALADMLVNASFLQEDIALEREVVIEEIARSEDQPEDRAYDLLADALFHGHPLGRPVLGNRETVSSFDTAQMRSYHDKHYVAENVTVVACGNVDHGRLVELARRYFSVLPRGSRTSRSQLQVARRKALEVETRDTEQAHLLIGFPGVRRDDDRRYACMLVDLALGGGMSSRLFQEIREKRGLAYSVYTMTNHYEDLGSFCMYAGTRPENLGEVISLAKAEFSRLASDGVSDGELERLKELACGTFTLSMESTRTHMTRLGRLATCGVAVRSMQEVIDSYRSVTSEEVRAAAEMLLAQQPSVALVSPIESERIQEML